MLSYSNGDIPYNVFFALKSPVKFLYVNIIMNGLRKLPELSTHEFATEVVFGSPFTEIHKLLDYPSSLYGKRHRRLYHDEETCLYLQSRFKDQKAYPVCMFHIFLDSHSDRHKLEILVKFEQLDEAERLVRRIYGGMEEIYSQRDSMDRGIRAQLEKDMRLVEEIHRLQREIREGGENYIMDEGMEEITEKDVEELHELDRMFGNSQMNSQQKVDIQAILQTSYEKMRSSLDKQQNERVHLLTSENNKKRNLKKEKAEFQAKEIAAALAPIREQLNALNRQVNVFAEKLHRTSALARKP